MTVAQETEARFALIFGRGGNALLEPYRCDDAEYIAVGLGSLTYQLRDVVETLRGEGLKVGVLGIRLYRPFPDEAAVKVLRKARGVFVIEKALSYGYEGALCSDIKAALYGCRGDGAGANAAGGLPTDRSGAAQGGGSTVAGPFVRGLVAGIGGRDIRTADLADTLRAAIAGTLEGPGWIGLKI